MNDNELSQKTLTELEIIAFATIDDFLIPGSFRLKNKEDIPAEKWIAVKKLTTTPKGFNLELHDKAKALGHLAEYLGILNEFNSAIACLRKYGLCVYKDAQGNWCVVENAN